MKIDEKYGRVCVGVITTGSRKLFNYNIPEGVEFFIYTDQERKGPAYARNRVIEHFEGCDHLFIFDDDAHMTLPEGYQYFIDQAIEHNVHYMAIPEWFKGKVIGCMGEMVEWNEALAACTYLSKKAIETVGGYNTEFHGWGYEDISFGYRCVHRAGLTTRPGAYCFPLRGMAYVYYSDAFGTTEVQNLTPEQKEYYRDLHKAAFDKETSGEQLYYPYKEGKQGE